MPRHDWHHDEDLMSRDRFYDERFDETRDRGAMFGRSRDEREFGRGRIGGWGSLMRDESSGGREFSRRERSEHGREQRFGPDDERGGIPRDETERLIASNKVEGTPVYDRNGDRLGSIHNFMVDKFRGRVVYAVLKHSSGLLGLDERYYPLEWDQLTFDTRLGGYHIDMTEEQLKGFGSWDRGGRWENRREMRPERARFDRGFGRDRELELHRDRDFDRGAMRDRW